MLLTRSVVRKVWKSTFSVLLVCLLMIQKCAAGFSNYTGDPCLSDSDCSEYRQICNTDIGFCQCNEFSTPYEYAPGKQLCMLCPGEGQPCEDNCCYGEDIFCIHDVCTQCKRKENGGFLCPNGGHLIFATASQIALSAALIIGIAALATLLFRMCSKRSLADRPRNRGLLSEDDARFSSERASLSSIQIRILQRLRDRPPRYETRHNYNFRSQSQDAGIAPPSYDSTAAPSTDTELPPSYTIAIGAPAFDNSGFTGEGEAERSRSAEAPDRRDRNSETSKSPILVDDDKAIHM